MSFFDAIKSCFQAKDRTPHRPKGPLGLGISAAFQLNTLEYRLIENQLLNPVSESQFVIEAAGTIDLGAGCNLWRYYTSGDEFLQINTTGGMAEENIEDIKLFIYESSDGITSRKAWEKSISAGEIGQHKINYRDKKFYRAFNENEKGNIPAIYFLEQVTNSKGETWPLHNFSMLYQREVAQETFEYLLINGEETFDENQQPEWLISYALGVDVLVSQLHIIS
ncbi:DUF2491 family protein [Rahnella sp. PCH160]|uniref:DUF2491 family protein n=1 Tax=Rahnella sp. PCH160 TaxID=3447928 RepID=UPI0039FDA2A3